jgi:MFS family permease
MTPDVSYLGLLKTRGVLRVFAPALVGRMSFAMVTLGILYAVQDRTGSFATAGAAIGAFGLANVIATPFRARLVDRWGQRRSLTSMAALFALGLCALAALSTFEGASGWQLVTLACFAGIFPPPLGASMRVLWSRVTPAGPTRTRAYSIDAVSEELLFTTGPLLGALLITAAGPQATLLATAGLAVVGTFMMTSSALSRESSVKLSSGKIAATSPLRESRFVFVLVALVAAGVLLGTVEVAAPAFAHTLDSAAIAGLLLSAFAGGSAIGGAIYGLIQWQIPLGTRLISLLTAMTVVCAALMFLPHLWLLVIGLIVVGFFLAPTLVTGYLLADDLTRENVRTEASSWVNTAINAGAAGGAVAVGAVIDIASPNAGFAVGAAMSLLLVCAAAPSALKRRARPQPAEEAHVHAEPK